MGALFDTGMAEDEKKLRVPAGFAKEVMARDAASVNPLVSLAKGGIVGYANDREKAAQQATAPAPQVPPVTPALSHAPAAAPAPTTRQAIGEASSAMAQKILARQYPSAENAMQNKLYGTNPGTGYVQATGSSSGSGSALDRAANGKKFFMAGSPTGGFAMNEQDRLAEVARQDLAESNRLSASSHQSVRDAAEAMQRRQDALGNEAASARNLIASGGWGGLAVGKAQLASLTPQMQAQGTADASALGSLANQVSSMESAKLSAGAHKYTADQHLTGVKATADAHEKAVKDYTRQQRSSELKTLAAGYESALKTEFNPEKRKAIEAQHQAVLNELNGLGGGGPALKPAGTASAGPPSVGTVKGGYKYKGGDPSKKENWAKV